MVCESVGALEALQAARNRSFAQVSYCPRA